MYSYCLYMLVIVVVSEFDSNTIMIMNLLTSRVVARRHAEIDAAPSEIANA